MITDVLPLALDAVPTDLHESVVQSLLDHISSKNGTWTGGIINNRFLFDVLHDEGHADVALAMLKKRDYPSYGYMYFNDLEPAKECMWELPDSPYQGTGMNSRNHHMFSSVGHYLVARVAGLSHNPISREFSAVVGSEPRSTATLHTTEGEAGFSWTRSSGALEVNVVVPEGLRARLYVPVADGPLHLDRRVKVKSEEVLRHRQKFNGVVLESGSHRLTTSSMAYV